MMKDTDSDKRLLDALEDIAGSLRTLSEGRHAENRDKGALKKPKCLCRLCGEPIEGDGGKDYYVFNPIPSSRDGYWEHLHADCMYKVAKHWFVVGAPKFDTEEDEKILVEAACRRMKDPLARYGWEEEE